MTDQMKINAEGEAVIPRELCERLNWRPGMELEIDDGGDRIVVRQKDSRRQPIDWEEFRRRMPTYDGPVISTEEMKQAIEAERAARWERKERRSR